ncbi:helix-turn-helix transcriptional regulator [Bosea sp. WAO]|uniref:helix-turn-helix transcriptional regulator n=1 Tax=Bosea sp. WAO TaxID=406341 RepID=UPI0020BD9025|nr:helix-turn-helix transcriptional regulator [Bosea sp. WAO]
MAGQVQLSRFHFCASFQLATGMTPREWLTMRMGCACCETEPRDGNANLAMRRAVGGAVAILDDSTISVS